MKLNFLCLRAIKSSWQDVNKMNIEEYKAKAEWYLAEEYMVINIEDMLVGGFLGKSSKQELKSEIDNLVESAYKKNKSITVLARKLKSIFDTFTS
jgi:hypothetical protein